METSEGNPRGSGHPPPRRTGGSRATVLGSLTIPGRPEQVSTARAFVAQALNTHRVGADSDTATLLTSEIVTNAIAHTKSGVEGGTVTIVVIGLPRGVLVEVIDDGSAGAPIVKGDLYASEGHGLFLVQHLAAQWGYLRDTAGTTVWFHLGVADEPQQVPEQAGPQAHLQAGPPPGRRNPDHARRAAAMNSATAPAQSPARPGRKAGPGTIGA